MAVEPVSVPPASTPASSAPPVSPPPLSAPPASPPPASPPPASPPPVSPPLTDGTGPPTAANGHRPDEWARPEAPPRRRVWPRPVLGFAEVVVATVPAVLFVSWSGNIDVDPLTRVGQVSGLAALQLRFAVISIGLVAVLVLVHRFGPGWLTDAANRLGCALIAGLATALPAAGVAVAVRHTPWALWANSGDNNWILAWTHRLLDGQDIPDYYPPLSLWALADWSRISGQPPEYALQDIQLFGAAMFGPAAYLTWRLTLRPVWALGIGVVATLPYFDPVKPYSHLTLIIFIPLLVKFLHVLRHADRLRWWSAVLLGAVFGAATGVLVLLYSGWFVWSVAGVLVATLVLMPWRRALGRALLFAVTTAAATVAVSWVHLHALLDTTGATSDRYFYFDTNTEPTYIVMWRLDRAVGAPEIWPPMGELGGVGVFTLLLAALAGLAIWFGWRRTTVLTVGCVAASAWVMRMWLASEQYATLSVRLYPRTTLILFYCLLLLAGFGVRYAVLWLRDRALADRPVTDRALADRPLGERPLGERPGRRAFRLAPVGVLLVPLLLVFASAGSATADKFMPQRPRASFGYFTYIAQHKWMLDGTCPPYGQRHGGCSVIIPP